jgi:hypothetical protein
MTRQQALKRKHSVEVVNENACSYKSATTDDIADSDVAGDEKEETD